MFEIKRYTADKADEWNLFVASSKNGTFLFDRSYMDYHADRFTDHSLMFYRDEHLYALLPANEKDHTLYSHQGLTYGGVVMGMDATTVHVMEIFESMNAYLREQHIGRVVYKAVPWIYHQVPAEEPLYAMHLKCHYRLLERDVSSTIVLNHLLKWKKDRRHGLRVARDNGVKVQFSEDYDAFWLILEENLLQNHHVSPVHSLDEIKLLHGRFPKNILLMEARKEGGLLGGCVIYLTSQVVHTQYIAATPEGKRLGVVNAIIDELLRSFPKHLYMDFGKSTETHSDILNEKLIYQKEGFGGRAICYDTYEWTL
jgi:hypothetical protein